MIERADGDLLKAPVEALVNPVNTVGVMGKGLALQFREAFPTNFAAYKEACRRSVVVPGRMFVHETGLSLPRMIINFPTKRHWRDPSTLDDVSVGLVDLARVLTDRRVLSVAIPQLGCGLGGLDWAVVRPLIVEALRTHLDTRILLFG